MKWLWRFVTLNRFSFLDIWLVSIFTLVLVVLR